MQAEKAAPAAHLPPRNKEEGGREGGREENNDHQKTEKRKIQRQIVCLQTEKRPGKREREREREFRRIGFYILEEQSTTIFGRIQNTFGEEICTY
jgi:hypothetical protein